MPQGQCTHCKLFTNLNNGLCDKCAAEVAEWAPRRPQAKPEPPPTPQSISAKKRRNKIIGIVCFSILGVLLIITIARVGFEINELMADFPKADQRAGFIYKNTQLVEGFPQGCGVTGEITNISGRYFDSVRFKVSVHDENGRLLDYSTVIVTHFEDGTTRAFNTGDIYVDIRKVNECKVDYEFHLF